MNASAEPADRRVLEIASEVSDVSDNVVPRLLVKIQGVLDTYPKGSRSLNKVKQDIWSLGLVQVALTTLKQEYGKILDGWNLASKVSHLVCQVCAGLEPIDSAKYNEEYLPDILHTLLMTARKLQAKFIKTSDILEDTKKDLMLYLKSVLDGIALLCSGPDHVAQLVLKSPWLLQLLLTDDTRSCTQVMGLIQTINRIKPGIFGDIEEKLSHQFLDELVYKLSASSDTGMAGIACRTIITICESHSPIVELLVRRYKGLKPLLMVWKKRGFERDLYRMEQLLEAGSLRQAELQKKHEAAMFIQAWWRSYHTRKKIKKAGVAMATFQRNFRVRRQQRDEEKQQTRVEADLRHMLLINRRKALRDLQARKLEALQILPAGEVQRFLEQESTGAAVQIQRHWRGHQTRKDNLLRRYIVTKTRAAILIQRTVRKWLERVKNRRREPPAWQRPPGLTDHRRVQLQEKILEWRENHELQTQSTEGREELHYHVQDLIKQFALTSRVVRRNQQRRELLLSRLTLDTDMLTDAPKLYDAMETDVTDYCSHSVPIATKARYNHTQELRLLRQPWWRKLGDEYQDTKLEEENESWKVF